MGENYTESGNASYVSCSCGQATCPICTWSNTTASCTCGLSGCYICGSSYVIQPTVIPGPPIPEQLQICQVCGAEGVVVFCEPCKDVLRLARKVWAEAIMEEIEDALS